MRRSSHHFVRIAVLLAVTLASSPALAQLDPLLFLKTQAPNVILVVETTNRMQRDADLVYYDPGTYARTGAAFEAIMGLLGGEATTSYRRKYFNLEHQNAAAAGDPKFSATSIDTVGDNEGGYATFYERTRLAVARKGLIQAINDNLASARFALIKTRQNTPQLDPVSTPPGNEGPVRIDPPFTQDPTDTGNSGKWKITRSTVNGSNTAAGVYPTPQAPSAVAMVAPETGSGAGVNTILQRDLGVSGALIPAGADSRTAVDTPIGVMLDDARTEASRLITADTTGCRNTVVVLVVGGNEGTINPQDLALKAATFQNVGGRRVPIYVVAIAPDASHVSDLQKVATESGGAYFEVTKAMIEAQMATSPGAAVPQVTRAVNMAVQHAYAATTTVNTMPTAFKTDAAAFLPAPLAFPLATPTTELLPAADILPGIPGVGPSTEFLVTSPVIGTVNLKGASHYDPDSGAYQLLLNSETEICKGGTCDPGEEPIPQRSNVLVTTAFSLPGFDGRLRALRVYRPEGNGTLPTPSGYRFVQDGSRLWVASTPAAATRNIYTVLPGSSLMVELDTDPANVAAVSPYLGVSDPSTLIDWVRNQPLGAAIGSTPAFLDPPSLDPPPDAAYPAFVTANKKRRALIFVGANDGMLHAIDARTGVEVWAFVPFNLLPKLRALRSGQSLDTFKYFMDSSAKIADVRVGANWRTYLFIGQGPGGTFYNALDVTLDNISTVIADDSTDTSGLLTYFSLPNRIEWKWSFPRNTEFDAAIAPYGDLKATASAEEKSVGETWSDPAVGQIVSEDGPYAMLVGSGFLKRSIELQANRGGARAGRAFYALSVLTGDVLVSRDVGADANGEEDDSCRTANNCARVKNALQMDPVATGNSDSRFVNKAYIGDLDGKVYRFDFTLSGTNTVQMAAPVNLYNAGASHPLFASMATVFVGGSKQYIFVGTGSDLLPSNGVNQSYSLLVLLDNGGSASKTAEILLAATGDATAPDEKVTAFPAVAGDIVFFSTTDTNPDPAAVCSPFSANLYAFTFIGGPAYDTNNDGSLSAGGSGGGGGGKKGGSGGGSTSGDSVKAYSVSGARATAPFIVDQHLVFAAGGKLDMFGDPNDFNNGVGQAGVRILSWRLVK